MEPDRSHPHYAASAQNPGIATYDTGLRAHFQRVYNIMSFGLVATGLVAWGVSQSEQMVTMIATTPLKWIVMLAPLAFIFFGFTPARMRTMSFQGLVGLFTGFSALMGLSLYYIFLLYSGQDIVRVFFITAGMFAATSIYGYTTRKDLSSLGSLMFMGLIGIIIASVVNLFMQSDMLHFVISVIGVAVFTGLTAWDTQNIKETYALENGESGNARLAVAGALSLYLNFINLFVMLLQLLGNRD